MTGSPGYAFEKLSVAMETLATGPGDVRSRLLDAYSTFHPAGEKDFPEHLRADWRWVYAQLTRYGPILDYKGNVDRGSVENTMNRIQRSTGVKIAKKLVYLHEQLSVFLRVEL